MDRYQLETVLGTLDAHNQFVYSLLDLYLWFQDEPWSTFSNAIKRHCEAGFLERPCRGVYLYPKARSKDSYILEHIAKVLRKGEYSYVSLESLLSEEGIISQIPLSRLTVMTTGRSQVFKTTYGTIEFTHTDRDTASILQSTYWVNYRPLRIATVEAALRDLRRVGRNMHLVDFQEVERESKGRFQ